MNPFDLTSPLSRRGWLRAGGLLSVAGAGGLAAAQGTALRGAEAASAALAQEAGVWRLAFGSCARQSRPQPIWSTITDYKPHLFVFLGDNFYADAETPDQLRARHAEFARLGPLQAFRRSHAHLAIWDDHDYGVDDAGGEYPHKLLSQQLFCDSWDEPADAPRRQRSGVFESYLLRARGKTVQLILPDLRFNRGPLLADPSRRSGYDSMVLAARSGSTTPVPGWYLPNPDPSVALLGEAQWQWLDAQLAQPADVRILASSVQFAAEGTGWECWWNFPAERQRLLDLLRRRRVQGLVAVSGDMHYGELSRLDAPGLYPLWDLTTSGLTEVWAVPTPNQRRVQGVVAEPNFGSIEIDWATGTLALAVRGGDGVARLGHRIALDSLRLPPT